MSITGDITADIYRQMMDLQEKLRQSEAERIQLKEMFTVLIKTFREEEDMRLKSLENRYHTFLEDCARRSYRNEKILRSVERVESGANALHAKTERLKLLRSHYEAYLERAISTWRQPSLLRYGSYPLPSTQEIEWNRRNRLIAEEKVEPSHMNYFPLSKSARHYDSNPVITSEYSSNRLSDDERYVKSFLGEKHSSEDNYWNHRRGEFEGKGKLLYNNDKFHQSDIMHSSSTNDIQSKKSRGKFESDFIDGSVLGLKGLESNLPRKLALGSRPNPPEEFIYQEDMQRESAKVTTTRTWDDADDHVLQKLVKASASPIRGEKLLFSDKRIETDSRLASDFDKSYINGTPRITREPVEIKKPEIIVGKVLPESSLKSDYFNKSPNSDDQSTENLKSVGSFQPMNRSTDENGRRPDLENVIPEVEIRTPTPQEKWSRLKHRQTIEKLKENLSYEEAKDQNMTKENKPCDKVEVEQKTLEQPRKEDDETDVSQSLSEGWGPKGGELMSMPLIAQTSDEEIRQQNGAEQFRSDEKNESLLIYQDNLQELSQKGINVTNDEVYEDNEEVYPESYYEQPSKSDYSRDIVSNVILEEDENEVNVHEELPEGSVQNQENMQENNTYEQSQYELNQEGNIQISYNNYNTNGTEELKQNENEYPNFQSSDVGYNDGNMYQADYNDLPPQEEYSYGNQDINNYNADNGLGYNNMEQYSGEADVQQYYESHQAGEQGNYPVEGMGQGENFDNIYNQAQNYESDTAKEQYVENAVAYQQEYHQGQDGNYYGEGEYQGYYESQQEPNMEYQSNNEQENVGYTEGNGYENLQGDPGYADGNNTLPLRQSNLSHLLESDTESFQMEHGSAPANEDSDFDFSMSQQQ